MRIPIARPVGCLSLRRRRKGFARAEGNDAPWRNIDVCASCPYWFPRPPLELISDHAEWIARMKHLYTQEGQVKEHERRRALVGDWSPRDTEAKPGLLKRLLR
jgi:hypothetical protein